MGCWKSLVWIRIGFNADPDINPNPAFYLNADPDPNPDSGSQTNADPDPGQTLKSQKVEFLHEKFIIVGVRCGLDRITLL